VGDWETHERRDELFSRVGGGGGGGLGYFEIERQRVGALGRVKTIVGGGVSPVIPKEQPEIKYIRGDAAPLGQQGLSVLLQE